MSITDHVVKGREAYDRRAWTDAAAHLAAADRDRPLAPDDLQRWAKTLLAPYKVSRALAPVEALPRNAMGKVVKPQVARLFD